MLAALASATPYCGAPPTAATLLWRWNLDPRLWVVLLVGAITYGVLTGRRGGARGPVATWRREAFAVGWALTALALVSPLCALSVSLFSARVGQHLILTLIAAPLVASGLPAPRARLAGQEPFAAALFAATLWIWHAPVTYAATFASDLGYWAMHITTYGAAVLFWWTIMTGPAGRLAASVAATVATGLQMALLGAVITWAPEPLYAPHLFTTRAWGFTPLQDQELGGAIMWIPAGLIFMAAVIGPLAWAMRTRPAGLVGLATR